MAAKLVNLGSLCVDYVYSVPNIAREGETVSSLGVEQFPGGKGLNQSISASLAGARVKHYGSVGPDGNLLLNALQEADVDTSGISVSDHNSGQAFIQVDSEGRNAIVIEGGSNRKITKPLIEKALDDLEEGDWLLLQNEINDLDWIIDEGARRGARIALNLAPVDSRIESYPLAKLSLLIVNRVEAQSVAGREQIGDALARSVSALLPETVVLLTEGKEGSILIDPVSQSATKTGSFEIDVVDETAAGDAFVGYFMAGLVENKDLTTSLIEASAAGALAVSSHGAATSIPARQNVEELMLNQSISQENLVP